MSRVMRLLWLTLSSVIVSLFADSTEMHLNKLKKWPDYKQRPDIIEDDIIPDSLSRNAVTDRKMLWPNGTVYYKIDNDFNEQQIGIIKRAMHQISSVSCIEFLPAPTNLTYFLMITRHPSECHASLGYAKEIRYVRLSNGCLNVGTILHELMHALGFHHQHNVPNRDQYVNILSKNIQENKLDNFTKLNATRDFGLPYDYESIMHYSLLAFTRNGKLTMEPLRETGGVEIGQTRKLSNLDIIKLNKLYKCCM